MGEDTSPLGKSLSIVTLFCQCLTVDGGLRWPQYIPNGSVPVLLSMRLDPLPQNNGSNEDKIGVVGFVLARQGDFAIRHGF
jgi:hypothetical protein